MVERAGRDVDEHLARTGMRVGDVLEPENVDATELVEHDRLHGHLQGASGRGAVYV
jgi:hypothetical protein